MDVDSLADSKLKVLSYLAIIGGGVGVFLDMMGLGVLMASRMSITEMAAQGAGAFTVGLMLVLVTLMLLTGYVLVEAAMDRNSRLTGWLLLVIGGIFLVDTAGTAIMPATELPAFILWVGVGLSIAGETALIMGGVYLRRML